MRSEKDGIGLLAKLENIIDEFDFSSHSHFYKFCKARFGYSPTELRKKLKSL